MENKYYTPELEEFYVGFEYEFMNGDNWEKGEIHIDDLITETSGGDACENWIEEIYKGLRTVRVKYLDKEDIESLGWEEMWQVSGSINFKLKNWEIYVCNGYIISLNEDDKLIWHFKGEIKNKSELRKLMKQLNIQ